MPTGWYAVQPPASGVVTMTPKKVTAALSGQQPEYGPIQASTKAVTGSLTGTVPVTGVLGGSTKPVSAAFAGGQNIFGGLAAQAKPVIASIVQASFTGTFAVASKPATAALVGSMDAGGALGASVAKAFASLLGYQEFTGSMAAAIQKATAAIAASQAQIGAIAAAVQKVTAKMVAPPQIMFSSNATFTTTRSPGTGAITSGLLQENDLVFIDIHTLQSTALIATAPTSWNLALAMYDFKSSQPYTHVLWHQVTAAEVAANTTSWTLTNVLGTSRPGRRITWVVRGADPISPIGATSMNGATTNAVNIPGIGPLGVNSLVVAGWGGNSASTTTSYTLPGTPWSLVNGVASSSNAVALLLQNANLTADVAIPDINAAVNRTDDFSGYMMEIKAAPV